jgi:hypothetical protein
MRKTLRTLFIVCVVVVTSASQCAREPPYGTTLILDTDSGGQGTAPRISATERGPVTRDGEATGFGLYVYLLPLGGADYEKRKALVAAYSCEFPPSSRRSDARKSKAIFLLPVRAAAWDLTGPNRVGEWALDTGLSFDLVKKVLPLEDIGESEIYIVVTPKPLSKQIDPALKTTIHDISHLAPELIRTWIIRLRTQIESGNIGTVNDWDLQARSFASYVGKFVSNLKFVDTGIASPAQPDTCKNEL